MRDLDETVSQESTIDTLRGLSRFFSAQTIPRFAFNLTNSFKSWAYSCVMTFSGIKGNTTQIRRKDIQGLRFVAISSVVLGHFFPGVFPGGFLGVDISADFKIYTLDTFKTLL